MVLSKAIIDADLIEADAYDKDAEKDVDLAAVSVLRGLLVSSEQEGGYAYSISITALQNRIAFLQNKWGIDEALTSIQPKVKSANRW